MLTKIVRPIEGPWYDSPSSMFSYNPAVRRNALHQFVTDQYWELPSGGLETSKAWGATVVWKADELGTKTAVFPLREPIEPGRVRGELEDMMTAAKPSQVVGVVWGGEVAHAMHEGFTVEELFVDETLHFHHFDPDV